MKRLLIIEDDKLIARIYAGKFTAAGYRVEVAGDGESGLQAVETFQPDVLLLDMMLPGISGLAVLKRLRAQPQFAALPVVVFSNIYLEEQPEEIARAGATCCLPKATTAPRQVIQAVNALVAAPVTAGPAPETEAQSQAEVRSALLAGLPELMVAINSWQQIIQTAEDKATRVPAILELYRLVHGLAGNASVAGVPLLARLASAFEALLRELYDKQNQINASTVRTIGQTIHFLGQLCERADLLPSAPPHAARIIAVDDEQISLRAVTTALGKAELLVQPHRDAQTAWEEMAEECYDLVILDINMPHLTGFDLCRKLRELPAYAQTPVIFVTSLHDFQSRAKGALSGADDLIAKPFLLIELGLKALTHVLRPQVPKGRA